MSYWKVFMKYYKLSVQTKKLGIVWTWSAAGTMTAQRRGVNSMLYLENAGE
jgi:hypothetical protein